MVWVKQLKVDKLELRTEEGCFVGLDEESKAFQIYWPKKSMVSIERDVYFNRGEALGPDEVQLEGEQEILFNQDASQATSTPKITIKPTKNALDALDDNPKPQNVKNKGKNTPHLPKIEPPHPEPQPDPTPPHQRMTR